MFPRSIRLCATGFAMMAGIAACGREPTDPSKSDLTGFWQSFGRDLYVSDVSMEIHQTEPGKFIGKWRAIGKVDNSCPVGKFCLDSSILEGRSEVSQVIVHLFGAGDFVGEQTSTNQLKGAIRSNNQNFHVIFTRK